MPITGTYYGVGPLREHIISYYREYTMIIDIIGPSRERVIISPLWKDIVRSKCLTYFINSYPG